jgi:hypothetical protein
MNRILSPETLAAQAECGAEAALRGLVPPIHPSTVRWQIGASLPWIRDVVFAEDASTTRANRAPQALAALRNLAVSLLHRWRRRDVTTARQFFAAHSSALLQRLTGFPRRL